MTPPDETIPLSVLSALAEGPAFSDLLLLRLDLPPSGKETVEEALELLCLAGLVRRRMSPLAPLLELPSGKPWPPWYEVTISGREVSSELASFFGTRRDEARLYARELFALVFPPVSLEGVWSIG